MGVAEADRGSGDVPHERAWTWLLALPHGVAVLDPVVDDGGTVVDVRYVEVNPAYERMVAATRADLIGRRLTEVHPERGAAEPIQAMIDVAATRGARYGSFRLGSGGVGASSVWVDGQVIVAIRDASDEARRNRVLDQLVRSLGSTSDFLSVLDPVVVDGAVVDFRVRLARRGIRADADDPFDAPDDELVDAAGVLLSERAPDFPPDVLAGLIRTAERGVPFIGSGVFHQRSLRGTAHVVASPYEDGIILSMRDTSRETEAQRALAESEAMFRATVDAMQEAIIVSSPDPLTVGRPDRRPAFRIDSVNTAAVALLDRTRDDLVGCLHADVLNGLVGASGMHIAEDLLDDDAPLVLEGAWVDAAGGPRRCAITVVRSGPRIVSVIRETTQEVESRRRLEESERRFRLLADHAGDVVFAGRAGMITWVAPSVVQLLGYEPEELVGTDPRDLVHPDDRVLIDQGRLEYPAGEPVRYRVRARRSDGSTLWVSVVVRPVADDDGVHRGAVVATWWSIQAEVEAQEELALAEAARHEQEVRTQQATRLESLGVMAGGIAHDFNNLLVGVLGNAELALMGLPEDSHARQHIERVLLAAQRAGDLTRQLLDYTGRRSSTREPVDIGALVHDMRVITAGRLGQRTELSTFVEPGTGAVMGDIGQLQQVLMNLVINASDALDGAAGHVVVRARRYLLDDDGVAAVRLAAGTSVAPGEYVELTVDDDGAGMDPLTLQRVFEPFYSTRSSGRGLGLAVVHGVVRAHHGAITAASAPGVGTTMRVILPAAQPVSAPAAIEAPSPRSMADASPLVLVVDDDEAVLQVTVALLTEAGARVEAVADGRDAIERFARAPADYAAVVLDLTMPGLAGDAVLAGLRRIDPVVPVVIVSGYSDADLAERLERLRATSFVRKPFRADDLVVAVLTATRHRAGPN